MSTAFKQDTGSHKALKASLPLRRKTETAKRSREVAQLLAIEHGAFWKLHSNSMAPALVAGDRVRIGPAGNKPVPGHIYAYRHTHEGKATGEVLVHRFIGWNRLAGDACRHADAKFKEADILGRVVEARRGDKELPVFLGPIRLFCMNLRRKLGWLPKQPTSSGNDFSEAEK